MYIFFKGEKILVISHTEEISKKIGEVLRGTGTKVINCDEILEIEDIWNYD